MVYGVEDETERNQGGRRHDQHRVQRMAGKCRFGHASSINVVPVPGTARRREAKCGIRSGAALAQFREARCRGRIVRTQRQPLVEIEYTGFPLASEDRDLKIQISPDSSGIIYRLYLLVYGRY